MTQQRGISVTVSTLPQTTKSSVVSSTLLNKGHTQVSSLLVARKLVA